MQEIHDPDFSLNKHTMLNGLVDAGESEAEHKFTIYKMDSTKKGFVG